MITQYRCDSSPLAAGPKRDVRGFLIVGARPARTGILEYRRPDGSVTRELRRDSDVFDPASLATFDGAPVTIGHQGDVTPANVKALEVGICGTARADGKFVSAVLSIRDAEAIRRIEAGELIELSAGYSVDLDPTPGVFEGQRYDAVQRRITINHVSLLKRGEGRSGSDVKLRLDSNAAGHASALDAARNARRGDSLATAHVGLTLSQARARRANGGR